MFVSVRVLYSGPKERFALPNPSLCSVINCHMFNMEAYIEHVQIIKPVDGIKNAHSK